MNKNLLFLLKLLLLSHCSGETNRADVPNQKELKVLISQKDSLPYPGLSMDTIFYDFVAYEKNKIHFDSGLLHFFQQLKILEQGSIQQVRIAHIGDSHVQADFFPGKLRCLFQNRFGNAGRGLVFPYQQAGTHSPIDFKTESKAQFESKRSVFQKGGPSIGISGMSIKSKRPDFDLFFYLKERYGQLQGFDQLSIFREPAAGINWRLIANEKTLLPLSLSHNFQEVFHLDEPVTSATIQAVGNKEVTIHGLLLENTSDKGILYNMMGVNGTTYYHFNRCEYLAPQLKALKPDLIILTLGTNEALHPGFSRVAFERESRNFLQKLKESCPQSSILITTLPDAWIKKRKPNPRTEAAREVLIGMARDFRAGYWDLFEIMGGAGSMQPWVEAQLGYVDYIHFTQAGYELQADLLFTALMNEYH